MPSFTGQPVSGKKGAVVVNGVIVQGTGLLDTNQGQWLTLEEWEVNPKADEIPTDNFMSSGHHERIFGFDGADVKFKGFWNANQNPSASPPNLSRGQTVSNFYLVIDTNVVGRWYKFPTLDIVAVPVKDVATGRVDYSVEGKSTRDGWTEPV